MPVSEKTFTLPPFRSPSAYKRISRWKKRQRRWAYLAVEVLIVITIVVTYFELRLRALHRTDFADTTDNRGNVTETNGKPSSMAQRDGEKMSDTLLNIDSYFEDFDKLQAHITSLSSSLGVPDEVATNDITRWRHVMHKMVSAWQKMDKDIELWREHLKYMQQAGKFLLLKCLHRDFRVPDGRVERWSNVTQLITVDDVFHFNRNGPHTITLKHSGIYLTTAAIKLRLNTGTSKSYVSYAMRNGTNFDIAACYVTARERCGGRKRGECGTERYDETCLMTSIEHMRAGQQLTIYDTSVQYTGPEQLDVVISDNTFWAVILLAPLSSP